MKGIELSRNQLISLMELMYELNSTVNRHSPIMIDKMVADIIKQSPARLRYYRYMEKR